MGVPGKLLPTQALAGSLDPSAPALAPEGPHMWLSTEGAHFTALAGLQQPARVVHGEGV